MRICIPTDEWRDASGTISGHFGHAARFTVLDTHSGRLEVFENTSDRDRPGGCRAVRQVRGLNVDAMVCRELGANAFDLLTKAGIALYEASATTVEGIALAASEGRLTPFQRVRTCQRGQHGHEGQHQHHAHGCGEGATKTGTETHDEPHGCSGERNRNRRRRGRGPGVATS